MRVPLKQQIKYSLSQQTATYNQFEPFLHVDNPTNARIVFDNGQVVGPYTLNAVVSTPGKSGSFQVDTSDVSYPNVSIFSNAQINAWLTDEEGPTPGISYAPVANITSTIVVSGNVNATVTNTINATITNASIPVTQSGVWNVAVTGSVSISGNVTIGNIVAGNVTFSNTQINVQNVPATSLNVVLPQTSLGNFTVNNNTNSANYTIPAGTHAIGIMVKQSGLPSNTGLTELKVTGVTTGGIYIDLIVPGSLVSPQIFLSGYFVAPVLSVLDTQVTVSATTTVSAVQTIYSVAILDAEGVFAFDNSSEPLSVAEINPQPWQAPGQSAPAPMYSIFVTIAALGTAVVVTGATNYTRLFGVSLNNSGAGPAQILKNAGKNLFHMVGGLAVPSALDFDGAYAAGPGENLSVFNSDSVNTATLVGTLVVSQT